MYSMMHFVVASVVLAQKSVYTYRVNFFMQLLSIFMSNVTFAVLWSVLLKGQVGFAGYSYEEIMLLSAILSASFGLVNLFCSALHGLSDRILHGDIDIYLLQPRNTLLNIAVSESVTSAWGSIFYAVLVSIFICKMSFLKFLFFVLVSCLSAIVVASFIIITQSMAFFLGDVRSLSASMYDCLITFARYPQEIFGVTLKMFLYTVLPVGFVTYLPQHILHDNAWDLLPSLFLATTIFFLLSYYCFHRGLQCYASGNQMLPVCH